MSKHRQDRQQRRLRRPSAWVAVLVAAVLFAGGAAAHAAATSRVGTVEDSRAVAPSAIFKGGPIRLGPRMYSHSDDLHAVVGVTSVRVSNCNLVLELDYQPGQRVMAAVVDEDETISRLGIQAGLSGGSQRATIMLWKNGKKVCPTDKRFGTVSNVWVSIITIDDQQQVT